MSGSSDWIEEEHRGILRTGFRVRRRLLDERSDFQRIEVVDTRGFGRMLFNDGVAMISERDEFVYHEMIAHVPLFVHPGARRALVIGGGDGGTVREILRHPTIEHCRLVEIDRLGGDACREHIPLTAAALDDDRVTVTIDDGVRFVADTDERYDLVVVDSTDPIGPGEPLFGPAFYAGVDRVLTDDGIVVSQAESPFHEMDAQRSLLGILAGRFATVRVYNYANLTYPTGLWSFSLATRKRMCPVRDLDSERVRRSGLEFRYYSADVHRAAFALPAFQERAVAEIVTPPR